MGKAWEAGSSKKTEVEALLCWSGIAVCWKYSVANLSALQVRAQYCQAQGKGRSRKCWWVGGWVGCEPLHVCVSNRLQGITVLRLRGRVCVWVRPQ